MAHTVETVFRQLSDRLAEQVTRSDSAAGELVCANGVAVRLSIEGGVVHAELDSLQGGPELWVLGPGGDDVGEFVDAVTEAADC